MNRPDLLKRRWYAAREAYGSALFAFYEGFKIHEEIGCTPSPKDMRSSPECFDGVVSGINMTEELIDAYLTLLQAERDFDRGYAVEGEPIDKLIAAFEEWLMKS
jgi:hypothetical protein